MTPPGPAPVVTPAPAPPTETAPLLPVLNSAGAPVSINGGAFSPGLEQSGVVPINGGGMLPPLDLAPSPPDRAPVPLEGAKQMDVPFVLAGLAAAAAVVVVASWVWKRK
jgi:hypothetical protein